jgi:hypothetical protein
MTGEQMEELDELCTANGPTFRAGVIKGLRLASGTLREHEAQLQGPGKLKLTAEFAGSVASEFSDLADALKQ